MLHFEHKYELKEILTNQISAYKSLNEKEIDYIFNNVTIKTYKKNEIIFEEGKVANSIYFILDGFVRLYYNVDGNEKTVRFYEEGKFFMASESFTLGTIASENYHAIEDTVLVQFQKSNLKELVNLSPEFDIIMQRCAFNELITYQKIAACFISLSPEERYVKLMETNHSLFLRAPQQYIASYLGVSAETLSRIKKRVCQKSKNKVFNSPKQYQCLGYAI